MMPSRRSNEVRVTLKLEPFANPIQRGSTLVGQGADSPPAPEPTTNFIVEVNGDFTNELRRKGW